MAGEDTAASSPDTAFEQEDRRWRSWAFEHYPDVVASTVHAAAMEAVRAGSDRDTVYQVALHAASLTPRQDKGGPAEKRVQAQAALEPLAVSVDYERGVVGLVSEGAELRVRSHGKNAVTRRDWEKEERCTFDGGCRVLVQSRDRVTFVLEMFAIDGKSLFRCEGIQNKAALDILLTDMHSREPSMPIDLAHPSHGLKDPYPQQVNEVRKRALQFNREEEQARANSGRQEVKVKTYEDANAYSRDAKRMTGSGWMPQGQASGRGGVSLTGTAGKLVLTGGLGAITGFSRKGSKVTVTWVRTLPFHTPRNLLPVPEVPAARSFRAEPYFPIRPLAAVLAGEEFPPADEEHKVSLRCIRCKAQTAVAGGATDYICSACRTYFFLRSCPGCSKTLYVSRELQGGNVKCVTCGKSMSWSAWQKRPVFARDLATNQAPPRSVTPSIPSVVAPPVPSVVVSARVAHRSQESATPPKSIKERMNQLSELKDAGLISAAEFEAKRSELLKAL